jgi:hypothetical protein
MESKSNACLEDSSSIFIDDVLRLHGQVQEVVGVMKKNIDKLLDRDVALNNLMTRADDLETSASTYNQTTKQLRRKYWWKNAKVELSPLFVSAYSQNRSL